MKIIKKTSKWWGLAIICVFYCQNLGFKFKILVFEYLSISKCQKIGFSCQIFQFEVKMLQSLMKIIKKKRQNVGDRP